MRQRNTAKSVALYGMLIALAFILSFVETLIPIHLGVPGVKLGLANLVTVVGLYTVGTVGTAAVSLARIVLVGFTFGNMFGILYSLAGWALSMLLMVLMKKTGKFSQIGVSIVGGVGHNIGQICIAALVVQNTGVFYYLPFLLAAGTVAGLLIGLAGGMIVERIEGFVKRL